MNLPSIGVHPKQLHHVIVAAILIRVDSRSFAIPKIRLAAVCHGNPTVAFAVLAGGLAGRVTSDWHPWLKSMPVAHLPTLTRPDVSLNMQQIAMNVFELRIVPHSRAAPAEAWIIPGSEPGVWLEELLRWNEPLADVALYLLPTSAHDRSPSGLLVLPPRRHREKGPERRGLAQPYRCRAGRLYLPATARLEPDVSDVELLATLPDRISLLHPVLGLVGFDPSDRMRVCDLLQPLPATVGSNGWDRAREGVTIQDRLLSVVPLDPPSLESILQSGQENIGGRAAEIPGFNLNDPGAGAGQAVKSPGAKPEPSAFQQWLARSIQQMTRFMPPVAGNSAWAKGMQQWAEGMLNRLSQNLPSLRNEKLKDLLKLLETDPELGLQFALPLAGEDSHRGIASGNDLQRHDVNFNLGHALGGGGGPASPWYTPADIYQGLVQRYRALAEREMKLGRFRRAAYIYAQLLADFHSAASALKQGKHFREAAILYRDKLKNSLEAARCYAEGGLLQEAIELYEAQKQFAVAAELWEKLERPEEAERCYRAGVELLLSGGQRLAAARMLHAKLHVPDEALVILSAAWPDEADAVPCLKERFEMLGRLGRHKAAAGLTAELRNQSLPTARAVALAALLAEQTETYPDQTLRGEFSTATRAVVSHHVREAELPPVRELLSAVGRLAPQDRLLQRDTLRYAARHRVARKPPLPQPGAVRNVRRFALPGLGNQFAWRAAEAKDDLFVIAGASDSQVLLMMRDWRGALKCPTTSWDTPARSESRTLGLSFGESILLLDPPNVLSVRRIHPTDRSALRVGTPEWAGRDTVAMAHGQQNTIWTVRRMPVGPPVLALHHANGSLLLTEALFMAETPTLASFSVEFNAQGLQADLENESTADLSEDLDARNAKITLACPRLSRRDVVRLNEELPAISGQAYVGVGPHLFCAASDHSLKAADLGQTIQSLAVSPRQFDGRVAAVCSHQVVVLQGDLAKEVHRSGNLEHPSAGFTRGGQLVIASSAGGMVLPRPGDKKPIFTFPAVGPLLPQILATDTPTGFAMITQKGEVHVCETQ